MEVRFVTLVDTIEIALGDSFDFNHHIGMYKILDADERTCRAVNIDGAPKVAVPNKRSHVRCI